MSGFYRPPPPKSSSKASSSTLCQKCLKKDIYECKAGAQSRPYVPRPSRTQQLLNPKLVPKLTNDVPNDLLRKKGVADEQLAQIAAERNRNRSRSRDMEDAPDTTRHGRSRSAVSDASSSSVSTISTNRSRTRSPPRRTQPLEDSYMTSQAEEEPAAHQNFERNGGGKRRRSPSMGYKTESDEDVDRNTRRRRSVRSPDQRGRGRNRRSRSNGSESASRSRSRSRGARREREPSPNATRRERSRSRSPYAPEKKRGTGDWRQRRGGLREKSPRRAPPPVRERSLSPFSKRLALTQAMGRGRGR